ncbi:MAG TPA: V-type ATPase subunit [Gemmatimonadales bacterium]|nr:V-type ATPase subunit [Gemmatimonadales bacterium]
MKPRWEDVIARVRGLGTHLLERSRLEDLARAPDLAALGEALRGLGFLVEETAATPAALDLAVRRAAAAHVRVLARWCGWRAAILAVVFEDEDRRSLRALLRGAVQGASPEARLAGLIPTPALPERALQTLARESVPGRIAALLVAWGNPYGAALLPLAAAERPDLFRLEVALSRTVARRALAAAGRAGRRSELSGFVRETIDLENLYAALVLAAAESDVAPKDAFVPGGERISIADFEAAIALGGPAEAARTLAGAFADAPLLAAAIRRRAQSPGRLEEECLAARIAALRAAARRRPLSLAPVLLHALRLRAQLLDLRRAVWGLALGAPAATLAQDLVTVP